MHPEVPRMQLADAQPFGMRVGELVMSRTCSTFVLAVHMFTTSQRASRRDIHQVKCHLLSLQIITSVEQTSTYSALSLVHTINVTEETHNAS